MKTRSLIAFLFVVFLLSGCSKGLSASEQLTCDALSEPWDSVDFNETSNFVYLYQMYGVSQLGDNSESAKILTQNKQMASIISDGLKEGDDEELVRLAKSHSYEWGYAASNGLNVLRSIIFTAKFGDTKLNSVQTELLNDAIGDVADALKVAGEIRARCEALGYESSL